MTRIGAWLAERVFRWAVGDAEAAEGILGDVREDAHRMSGRAEPYTWVLLGLSVRYVGARLRDRRWGPAGGGHGRRSDGTFSPLVQDLRYAIRTFVKQPGFTAAVALTLGLGIGANTALFTVVDPLLIRPLSFAEPERLVDVHWRLPGGGLIPAVDSEMAETWAALDHPFASWSWAALRTFVRTGGAEPVSHTGRVVSWNLFETLGVAPAFGRGFAPDDAVPGATAVVVLSHGLWVSLGADPATVGGTVELDGVPYVVIGVMPRGFKFPVWGGSDLWVPATATGAVDDVSALRFESVARLPENVSIEQAQGRLDAMAAALTAERPPPSNRNWDLGLTPFDAGLTPDVESALRTLSGAVAIMLVIAAVNAVNLLLARSHSRRREIALRAALGASRTRIFRQLVTESLLLSLIGGAVAVAIAWASVDLMLGLVPHDMIYFSATDDFGLDGRVLAFAFLLSVGTGLAAGLVPSWRLVRVAGTTSNAAMVASTADGPASGRFRNGLVVAEVALSVTLLANAGLFLNSFVHMMRNDPGFDADRTILLSLRLNPDRYESAEERLVFFDALETRLAAVAGVEGATLADGVPPLAGGLYFDVWTNPMFARTRPHGEDGTALVETAMDVLGARVRPSYFEVLGIPIVAGRPLLASDDPASGNVVIDQRLAQSLWADNPVGRRFRLRETGDWFTVVGVSKDVKLAGQSERRGSRELFMPLPRDGVRDYMSVAIRTTTDPAGLIPTVRRTVWTIDANQPIAVLTTGRQALARAVDQPRFVTALGGVLAAVALALAALGVYGVLAFTVSRRMREMGIRIAVGARAGNVTRLVVRHAMTLAAVGIALGLLGALGVSHAVRSQLYAVEPTDPMTLLAVSGVMLVAALVASYVPARRAMRVDPLVVLKTE